jgi:hypothetical protein
MRLGVIWEAAYYKDAAPNGAGVTNLLSLFPSPRLGEEREGSGRSRLRGFEI